MNGDINYDDIDDINNNDAANVIADYDDYPQYDYDGDYEEGLTGSGGPDYGQYYDYDYESRNSGPTGGDFNDENEQYGDEEYKVGLDENVNIEQNNDETMEKTYSQDEIVKDKVTQEASNHEVLSTTTSTSTTTSSTTIMTTLSTTTTSLPTTTTVSTLKNFYFLLLFISE